MSEIKTKIVIIKDDVRATVFPQSSVDTEAVVNNIIQDTKDLLNLKGDFELYIKVNPRHKLSAIQLDNIEGIIIITTDIKPNRSVNLG